MGILRFFLALSVAVFHLPGSPFKLVYFAVAVLCFFIISGFYMAMVLSTRYDKAGEFYWARITRLYPAYFAMAAVMVAWFWWTNSPNAFTGPLSFNGRPPVSPPENIVHMLLNVLVFGQDLFELTRQSPSAPIRAFVSGDFFNSLWMLVGQAWSLSTEAFFYSLAPFVVRNPRRIMLLLVVTLTVRTVLLGVLGWPWVWGYFFPPASMSFFFLGSMMYHLYSRLNLRHGAAVGASMGLLLAGWALWSLASDHVIMAPSANASVDGPRFWVFYVIFAIAVPYIFEATKDSAVDRWIGELSYPLYLVHGLVQGIIYFKFEAVRGDVPTIIFALGCSVAAAILMRLLVEWPIEKWRNSRFHGH